MSFLNKIYLKLRPLILPIDELIQLIPIRANILDLGCGRGVLLNNLKTFNSYTGVDLSARPLINKKIKFIKDDCISFIERDLYSFNTFTIIDLIHHIPKQQQFSFLTKLVNELKKDDILIIKDIYPRNIFFNLWNKLHDLIFAHQLINYFNFKKFEFSLNKNIKILRSFHKRILFYDHYFLVLKKI